ncbi:hypothetical protein [Actinomadura hibisca]|uniref:hypothetical protein n=1 Tax=Actinomadura hibisca TaxID=68565 RepID=UPI00082AD96F|nr:hypothetical protein [Actinomadura hibisca]
MRCPACGSDTGTGTPRCARCNAPLPVPGSEQTSADPARPASEHITEHITGHITEHVTILDPRADAALASTSEFVPPPARPASGGRAAALLKGPVGWVVAGVLALALAGALTVLWPGGGAPRPAGDVSGRDIPTGSPDGADAATTPASASPSAPVTVGERFWVDTFQEAEGFARPDSSSGVIGTLDAGRNWVLCRRRGSREQRTDARGRTHHNHWWLLTSIDRYYGDGGHNPRAWVSALYLTRWGDDEAKDNDGRDVPQCPPGDLRAAP